MKQLKRVLTAAFVILDIILITGGYDEHSKMYRWIGHPLANGMTDIAHIIGGVNGIGWAIIIITAILRLILLPFFLNQQVNTTINQIKMQTLKPEIDKLQALTRKAGTTQEQQQASMSMMSLYRENDVSVIGGISFLTMAMQLPIFSGLYSAILHAPALKGAEFLGFNLGKPQIVFAMIASGAIGLCFVVGGLFALIQTLIQHYQRPGLEKRVAREFKIKKTADDLMQESSKAKSAVTATDSEQKTVQSNENKNKKQRNAGKQNR